MDLSQELSWRGFIKDKTFADIKWLDKPQTFYHGVDGSADSLTIGNLAALMMARHFVKAGWRAVLLAGGATSLIGDPGGKETERPLVSKEQVAKNINAIAKQVEKLFAGQKIKLLNNADWLNDLRLLDFLRDVGKQYPITELTQRDFVAERTKQGGSGISYAEFSYTLIQGYDFWHLYKKHGVKLQIGGSDQWGNMLSGVSLIRKLEGQQTHALSMPLIINKATGNKFGKTEAGAIWLDSKKTSPTEFYQFWINVDDADVEDYLRVFTLLPKDEITKVMTQHKSQKEARVAQAALAHNITELVHGSEETKFAESVTDYLTAKSPIVEANPEALKEIRKAIPSLSLQPGSSLVETLVQTGLASSNSEARRLLEGGAIYLNNQAFNKAHLESKDFPSGRALLRRGKAFKDSALLELI